MRLLFFSMAGQLFWHYLKTGSVLLWLTGLLFSGSVALCSQTDKNAQKTEKTVIGWCPEQKVSALHSASIQRKTVFYQYANQSNHNQSLSLVVSSDSLPASCHPVTLAMSPDNIVWVSLLPYPKSTLAKVHHLHSILLSGYTDLFSPLFQPLSVTPLYYPAMEAKRAVLTTTGHHTVNIPRQQYHAISQSISPQPKQSSGTWVWDSQMWIKGPEKLLALAQTYQMNRLYCHIPLSEAGNTTRQLLHEKALIRFIRQANEKGIAIWIVLGNPTDILESGQKKLLAHVKMIQGYNQRQPKTSQIKGFQFDIEPHLLPGFSLQPAYWLECLRQTYQKLSSTIDLPIEAVLPFWFAEQNTSSGENIVDAILPYINGITVMDYTTNQKDLTARLIPFLDKVQNQQSPNQKKWIRMAVEFSKLPPEWRWRFSLSDPKQPAQLNFVKIKEKDNLYGLVLFSKKPYPIPNTMGFTLNSSMGEKLLANRITFYENHTTFWQMLPDILSELSQWQAFDGVLIHDVNALSDDKDASGITASK